MCLDFCARVVEREGDHVIVESAGMRRRATTLLAPDVAVGDWVRVAIGSVIERLDPAAAHDINEYVTTARGAAQ
jgi:hydrogenase assembly chaperone HypC/HupF